MFGKNKKAIEKYKKNKQIIGNNFGLLPELVHKTSKKDKDDRKKLRAKFKTKLSKGDYNFDDSDD
jgi:hypothetical protein